MGRVGTERGDSGGRRYAMRPPAVFWVLLSFALMFPVGGAEAAGCTSISCAVSGSGGPYTTPYGAPIVIAVPIGDYAKDYYNSVLSPTSAGSLVEIGADANNDYVEFVPAGGFTGQVSITSQYQRTNTDGGGGNQTIIVAGTTVTVTVLSPTPAPTTSNGSMTAAYNGSGSSTLNIAGSYTSVTLGSPAHGTVTSAGGDGVTYTPYSGFSGTDSFSFSASGPGGVSNTSTETVTVGASPPTVGAGYLTVPYGTSGQVVAQVSGVYTSVSASNGSHGAVTLAGQTATYTPNSGFYGADSFTISAAGPGGTGTGTINVTVQPPSAPDVGNVYLSVGYGASGSVGLAISGSYSSIHLGSPSHGTASLNGSTVVYTPAAGYGSDAITYSASGPGGTSGTAQVSITVSPPGGPSITGGSISTPYQTQGSLTLNVSGVYSSITATSPAHGSVAISGTTAAYTPVSGFYGADSFQVSVSGPGGTSGLALVTVTVGLPPAPTVAHASISSSYNGSGSTALSVSGVYSLLTVSRAPTHGSVSFSGAMATYVPTSGYYGADTFTYTATGPGGASSPATVSVQVALPPAPTVAPGSISSTY
jgi:hypothetical protein